MASGAPKGSTLAANERLSIKKNVDFQILRGGGGLVSAGCNLILVDGLQVGVANDVEGKCASSQVHTCKYIAATVNVSESQ